MELLPLYLQKENVVAVGEIGYDDQTPAEDRFFRAQLELAKTFGMSVQVHTPHRDKKAGTIRSMEICLEHGLEPSDVIIDHNNEETVKEVLDRGFWAAFTIYPKTKMGNEIYLSKSLDQMKNSNSFDGHAGVHPEQPYAGVRLVGNRRD